MRKRLMVMAVAMLAAINVPLQLPDPGDGPQSP